MRATVTVAAALVAAAAAHGAAPRASLLGNVQADVRAARERARERAAGAPAAAAAPSARLTARALTAHAPPSGLVDVRVAWAAEAAGWVAAEDVITLACAADAALHDVVDFFGVDAPAGERTVRLPHGTGCDFHFNYVRGGAALFAAAGGGGAGRGAARAGAPARAALGADTDAVGTRLAFGDAPGDMLFTWASLDGAARATVRVGTAPGGPYTMNFSAPGAAARSYKAADMCHAPASEASPVGYVFPGFFHTVALNLTAGTRYYAVYGQAGGAEAPETSFRTRAARGPDVPARFAAYGDAATYPVFPGTVTTVGNILALDADGATPIDFVTNIGDLAYAEGSVLLWTFWTGLFWPLTSRLPFQVTVGNHVRLLPPRGRRSLSATLKPSLARPSPPPPQETNVNPGACKTGSAVAQLAEWPGPVPATNAYGDDSGGEAGVATFARYSGPSTGFGVFWYSFDVGNVHFVLWSSEHDYTPGSAQEAWLRADLLGVDRGVTPWLIVGMHRPMFNARVDGDWSINVGMAANLEQLFVDAKVDLALSGHYHLYERTHSMRNYTVDATGRSPVYVTVGTGGATYHNETVRPDARAWSAFDASEWGFGVVETFNRSALRFTFRANDDGGRVRDEAWIMRPERA